MDCFKIGESDYGIVVQNKIDRFSQISKPYSKYVIIFEFRIKFLVKSILSLCTNEKFWNPTPIREQ